MSASNVTTNAVSKKALWSGRILATLLILFLIMDSAFKFVKPVPAPVVEAMAKVGWPLSLSPILGTILLCCCLLYIIPRTSVLGAILLTGYLGGAVATHVRVSDNFAGPAIGGVLVWLGLFLRDPRIRALLPIRRAPPTSTEPPKP